MKGAILILMMASAAYGSQSVTTPRPLVREYDLAPSSRPAVIQFPNNSVSFSGGTATVSFAVLPLAAGDTSYIQNTTLLQPATFYVSSGTVKDLDVFGRFSIQGSSAVDISASTQSKTGGLNVIGRVTIEGVDILDAVKSSAALASSNFYVLGLSTENLLATIKSTAALASSKFSALDTATTTLTAAINSTAALTSNRFAAVDIATAALTTAIGTNSAVALTTLDNSQTKSGSLVVNRRLGVGTSATTYGVNISTNMGLGGNTLHDAYFPVKSNAVNDPLDGAAALVGTLVSPATYDTGNGYVILHPDGSLDARGAIEYSQNLAIFDATFQAFWTALTGSPNYIWLYWGSVATPNSPTSGSANSYGVVLDPDNDLILIYFNGTSITSVGVTFNQNTWYTCRVRYNAFTNLIEVSINGNLVFSFTDSTRTLAGSKIGVAGIVVQVASVLRTRQISIDRLNGLSGFTRGSLLVAESTANVTEYNNKLFWDIPNSRLGVGTNTASSALDVFNGSITIRGTNAGVNISGVDVLSAISSTSTFAVRVDGSTQTKTGWFNVLGNLGIGTVTPTQRLTLPQSNISLGGFAASTTTAVSVFVGKTGTSDNFSSNSGESGMEIESTTSGGNYSQKMHFLTHLFGSSSGRRVTISEAGNVGIGTLAPAAKLDVAGHLDLSVGRTTIFHTGDNRTTHRGGLQILTPDNGQRTILTPTDQNGATLNSNFLLGGLGDFNTNTIGLLTSGNVGIGTAGNTVYKLAVTGSGTETTQFLGDRTVGVKNNLAGAAILANTQIGSLGFINDNNVAIAGISAHFSNAADGAQSYLTFKTGNTADRMVINTDGNVGVGTASVADKFHIHASSPVLKVTDSNGALQASLFLQESDAYGVRLKYDANSNTFFKLNIMDNSVETTRMAVDRNGNVGIGEAVPSAWLQLGSTFSFRSNGHFVSTGTIPSVGNGVTDCGTSPNIRGTDLKGVVTVGSVANGGKCTVTFAQPYPIIPVCVAQNSTTANLARAANVSATAFEIAGTLLAGDLLTYICLE